MRTRTRTSAALAVSALALFACNEKPLAMRSIVAGPRLIGLVAEPPEVTPGQPVLVRPILAGVAPEARVTYRWLVCARPEATTTFTASSTFGQAEPDEGCFGVSATNVIELGSRPEAFFAVPSDLLDRIDALQAVYGRSLSSAALRRIADTAGLPFTVSLELTVGDTVLRALKRVVVTTRAQTNSNPPPLRFRFAVDRADGGVATAPDASLADGGFAVATGGIAFESDGADPDRCVPVGVSSVTVEAGAVVEIAPDEHEDAWLETYPSLDSTGAVTTLREEAFYAWFTTAGEFSLERTRRPLRDTVWTAPRSAGPVTQWLAVRDGRGGTAFCRYELRVVAPEARR